MFCALFCARAARAAGSLDDRMLAAAATSRLLRASFLAQDAKPAGAIVLVSRATKACFSASVRVTGFLVPRREAMVTLDMEGYRITEILANEGDRSPPGSTSCAWSARRKARPRRRRAARCRPGGAPGAQSPPATMVLQVAGRRHASSRAPRPSAATASRRSRDRAAVPHRDRRRDRARGRGPEHPRAEARAGADRARRDRGGRELNGNVRLVPAEINPMSQLGRVRVSVERDPSSALGSFARATIDASRSCGVSVPQARPSCTRPRARASRWCATARSRRAACASGFTPT